ncbi:MAG TPA: outer membrane beta-barrel protein [Vicinamibacterales bacterium]|nr:outer membrane beta-barrel protein [Vicinamibacterales bacterium]
MSIQRAVLLFCVLTAFAMPPSVAHAQDFAILESAETINKGNFKLRVSPLLIFGKGAEDNEPGVAILAGYGFTSNFDMEGGVAFFDGVTFWGANAEVWLVKERPFDFSVAGGFHRRTGDNTESFNGLDLTFLASGHVTRRLELYGGLDLAFEGIGDPIDFKTAHFVPGIEFKITDNLDLVAEAGLALNDNARHYIAGGLAFYVR